LRAPGLPQSENAWYEKHHNNNTNDVKIFMSVSPLFSAIGSSSTFKLILGEKTKIMNIIANGKPTGEGKLNFLINHLIIVG